MTKITNSADLNNYYKDVVSAENGVAKKNKTRLIILKDKKTGEEYLDAKKLTLPERIGALFGGKASFSRVVEFCNQKNMHSEGLAKLVGKYNQSHTTNQIKYLFINKAERFLVTSTKPEPLSTTDETLIKHENERIIDENIKEAHSKDPDVLVEILEKLPTAKKQQILDEACSSGDTNMIVDLYYSGMKDFNSKNSMYTPLMRAAEAGHHHVVLQLMVYGADPNIGTEVLGDPLLLAAKNGSVKNVQLIATSLCKQNLFTPERLLQLLEDPSINDDVKETIMEVAANQVNKDGKTAIMLAIDAGKLNIATRLSLDSDLRNQDSDGNNPLLLACKQPQSEARDTLIASLLMYEPTELFHKNKSGVDAISYAVDQKPELLAEFEKYAKETTNPEAQKILARLAEVAKKAEETAQRMEEAKQTARQAEISKHLATIKTEAGKQKVEDVRSLPALGQGQDTPLLVAYTAIDKTALKDTDPKVRGFILLDLTRRSVGTTKEDHETLITKNLTSARLPLMWLKAQMEKLPPTGASTKDKVAKLDFETKGKNLMAAYKPVIDAKTYTNLLKDYPAFKPL